MTWFTIIMIGIVAATLFTLLFTTRFLFEGRTLCRVRLCMLLFDVLGMGWFVGRAVLYHLISGPAFIIETIIIGFMTQIICTVFVLLAVILRFVWRRMMAVPVNESRRRLLVHASVYPAAALGLSLYGGLWERQAVVEREFTIPVKGLGAGDGYRLAQLSDIHLGSFFSVAELDQLLAKVAARRPDLLAVTGDLFDDVTQNEEAAQVLDKYAGAFPDGIWFCFGNHEHFRGIRTIRQYLAKTRVQVLCNESRKVPGKNLWFVGVDYPMDREHFAAERKSYMEEACGNLPQNVPTILLGHHPECIDDGAEKGIALTLTGHTHGSQIGIFGKPLFPVFKYTRGMVKIGDSYGYVHSGNGSWFPFRLGCPPEIAYFTLKNA
ncbi:metallophosphoesterase [Mitsuokella sp.]|uniref:metallophosphoesterase n=1 Tax=unclassified Mitsuokella TaxID=2637239 RepID=UPI003D7EC22D